MGPLTDLNHWLTCEVSSLIQTNDWVLQSLNVESKSEGKIIVKYIVTWWWSLNIPDSIECIFGIQGQLFTTPHLVHVGRGMERALPPTHCGQPGVVQGSDGSTGIPSLVYWHRGIEPFTYHSSWHVLLRESACNHELMATGLSKVSTLLWYPLQCSILWLWGIGASLSRYVPSRVQTNARWSYKWCVHYTRQVQQEASNTAICGRMHPRISATIIDYIFRAIKKKSMKSILLNTPVSHHPHQIELI